MLKRGIKRRPEDDYSEAQEEYAANLSNFQIAARRRESLRLKQTVSAAPGLVEKNLKDKIAVEMSLVEGTAKFIMACKNQSQVSACVLIRIRDISTSVFSALLILSRPSRPRRLC